MKKLLLLLSFVCSFGSAFATLSDTVGCVGSNTDVSSSFAMSSPGLGYYTSSNPAIASVDTFTGIVHALSVGSVIITGPGPGLLSAYSLPFHVYPSLGASITGADGICAGATTALAIAASGGTWSSSHADVGTVDGTGTAGGVSGGATNVIYFSSGACASHPVHVAGVRSDSMIMYYTYNLCSGTVISLTPGSYAGLIGGTWSSSNPTVATVEPSPGSAGLLGNVWGVSGGTATISYTLVSASGIPGCDDTHVYYRDVHVTNMVTSAPITGRHTMCIGTNDTLLHPTSGGYWYGAGGPVSSLYSSTSLSTGALNMLTGVSAGTRIITYSFPASMCMTYDTFAVTVLAADSSNTPYTWGPSSVCTGSSISLSTNIPGGFWGLSLSYAAIATASTSGVIYGVSPGTPGPIGYTVYIPACGAYVYGTYTVTVSAAPYAGTVTGPASMCETGSASYLSSATGGIWIGTPPLMLDASGVATAYASGAGNVEYVVTNACGADTAIRPVVVNAAGVVGAISGSATVAEGNTIALSNSTSGGVWSVSSSTTASIDAATGVLTGIHAGTVIVTYTLSGCYAPSSVTYTVTVTPTDVIMGSVYFAPTTYTGNLRIWLIAYSAPMLTAIDSVDVYSAGSSAAYQFLNEPAGTYRIKAAPLDGPLTGMGFIPTYYTSSLYWSTADTVIHATASVNAGVNINLMTGTVTTGPGFIAGDVTTGANKGTTDGAPVNNLMMYLLDATNTLYQCTRTNAAGHYSFSDLPTGTYYVFPDSLNYATIPYTGINITSGSPSFTNASFIQHTLSHVISPVPVGISNTATGSVSIVILPNPTKGKVTIAWRLPVAQHATIVVADITGRVVTNNTLDMASGAGNSELNLSNLVNGLYTIVVKSADISYTTKIQIQH